MGLDPLRKGPQRTLYICLLYRIHRRIELSAMWKVNEQPWADLGPTLTPQFSLHCMTKTSNPVSALGFSFMETPMQWWDSKGYIDKSVDHSELWHFRQQILKQPKQKILEQFTSWQPDSRDSKCCPSLFLCFTQYPRERDYEFQNFAPGPPNASFLLPPTKTDSSPCVWKFLSSLGAPFITSQHGL